MVKENRCKTTLKIKGIITRLPEILRSDHPAVKTPIMLEHTEKRILQITFTQTHIFGPQFSVMGGILMV